MPLRIVFMGTPAFAVPSLHALVESGRRPGLVVTRPAKPKGRGLEVAPSEVESAARGLDLPVASPPKFHDPDFLERLRALGPDLFVIVAYGVILREAALAIPRLGCINLHASLLPRWRGVAPLAWQVYAGDAEVGVTTQWIDAGVDTGRVILRDACAAPAGVTTGSLTGMLAARGAQLIVRTLAEIEAGRGQGEAQDEARASQAPRFTKADGVVDWARPASELERAARAFEPWPGLKFTHAGEGVRIRRAALAEGAGAPGEVLRAGADGLDVACGEGALRLVEVQPDGKRPMPADAWARGRNVTAGTRLAGTPR